jgi:hypothetical protein
LWDDLATAAPPLNSVTLDPDEAKDLYERVVRNIDIMLTHNRIHGDLSAYNILYWEGDIKLIDFPQVVLPESNPSSWNIFQRDVIRICQYFSSQGVDCDARKLLPNCGPRMDTRCSRKLTRNFSTPKSLKTVRLGISGSRETSLDANRGMFYFNSLTCRLSGVRKWNFRCKIIGKEKLLYE